MQNILQARTIEELVNTLEAVLEIYGTDMEYSIKDNGIYLEVPGTEVEIFITKDFIT